MSVLGKVSNANLYYVNALIQTLLLVVALEKSLTLPDLLLAFLAQPFARTLAYPTRSVTPATHAELITLVDVFS
jgi:hypothetical protein